MAQIADLSSVSREVFVNGTVHNWKFRPFVALIVQ